MNRGVTAVQAEQYKRGWFGWLMFFLIMLVVIVGIGSLLSGVATFLRSDPVYFESDERHFRYGSFGSENESGLPVRLWRNLPSIFPEKFDGKGWERFGFIVTGERPGYGHSLPEGIGTRVHQGVELGWFNCGMCHIGSWRESATAERQVVVGMPAHQLDLHGFVAFLFDIVDDPRFEPAALMEAMQANGETFGLIESFVWRWLVLTKVKKTLMETSETLTPLLKAQEPWAPGRVETFNLYKMLNFGYDISELGPDEIVGVADFPSVWKQGPRNKAEMQLHWDGNNTSLNERNLSAAIGDGAKEHTVDHEAIERMSDWLMDLPPPPSPHRPEPEAVERGKPLYMSYCAECHGHQEAEGFVFEGDRIGKVTSNDDPMLGTDPARLVSYTERFAKQQLQLFKDYPEHRFREFRKTDGYANMPLEGLWLRAPYLHHGGVPTLKALLDAPEDRPDTFIRGIDIIDWEQGGFVAPSCDPDSELEAGFCFDTSLQGNGKGGHLYGTDLPADQKADLLAYLLTF